MPEIFKSFNSPISWADKPLERKTEKAQQEQPVQARPNAVKQVRGVEQTQLQGQRIDPRAPAPAVFGGAPREHRGEVGRTVDMHRTGLLQARQQLQDVVLRGSRIAHGVEQQVPDVVDAARAVATAGKGVGRHIQA